MSSTLHFQGQSTLSELFTVVYLTVNDYLKRSVEVGRFSLPVMDNQKGSYAELMTIALVGELRRQDQVGDWFDPVKVEYAGLFPELPHRTRYYRVLKRLEHFRAQRETNFFADFALRFTESDMLHVIDCKSLPIGKGTRWQRLRAMTEATSGRGGLGWFYGFKLLTLTNQTSTGLSAVSPANEHDDSVAKCLLADTAALVIGDKGYAGSQVYAQPKDNELHPRV